VKIPNCQTPEIHRVYPSIVYAIPSQQNFAETDIITIKAITTIINNNIEMSNTKRMNLKNKFKHAWSNIQASRS